MIISIRGTSGAGKSTIVRAIMEAYPGTFNRIMVEKRKRPIALLAVNPNKNLGKLGQLPRSLFIVGHYDIPCGGADTISGNEIIYGMVRDAAKAGHDVIFEGRIIGVDVRRTAELATKYPVTIFHIDIPLEECLASINERRRRKNPDATDVNPKNTTNIFKQIPRCLERLRRENVACHQGSRAEIEEMVKEVVL